MKKDNSRGKDSSESEPELQGKKIIVACQKSHTI